MESLTDASGYAVEILPEARRVVSLVPSTTETLFRLGGGEQVVGVTRYCIHPKEAREHATVVGGTKSCRFEKIASLNPDLILANQEENRQEDVERLRKDFRVYVSMPETPAQASVEIARVGRLIGKTESARRMSQRIDQLAGRLKASIGRRRFTFAYLIWKNPFMVAGKGTFVDAILTDAGGSNAIDERRYPELGGERLRNLKVDHILLSSEPFPFDTTHRAELIEYLRDSPASSAKIHLVDGELISWHGARLLAGIPYVGELAMRLGRAAARRS